VHVTIRSSAFKLGEPTDAIGFRAFTAGHCALCRFSPTITHSFPIQRATGEELVLTREIVGDLLERMK
jgi:hypothetical protein